jgi:hypothetical protein
MSETTHMICARCGRDNTFSNAPYESKQASPILVTVGGSSKTNVSFLCQNGCTYELPFQINVDLDNLTDSI